LAKGGRRLGRVDDDQRAIRSRGGVCYDALARPPQHVQRARFSFAADRHWNALIEKCLAGDQQAWDQIVRQHWRKVFNLAYKFVGRHDEAEDLTQDIFSRSSRRCTPSTGAPISRPG
jgi:hypothetical protein